MSEPTIPPRCDHDPYWKGHYGTCMACRAESAEAERDRLAVRLRRAEELLRMFVAPDVQRVAAFLAEPNPTEKQA